MVPSQVSLDKWPGTRLTLPSVNSPSQVHSVFNLSQIPCFNAYICMSNSYCSYFLQVLGRHLFRSMLRIRFLRKMLDCQRCWNSNTLIYLINLMITLLANPRENQHGTGDKYRWNPMFTYHSNFADYLQILSTVSIFRCSIDHQTDTCSVNFLRGKKTLQQCTVYAA